jgi:hypothetical protein
MPLVDGSIEYDIMLSPQFYTIKREKLNIKYRYQAKKLAQSILENLLPADHNYSYYTFKDEDEWVFIAYDIEKIIHFLKPKGVEAQDVSRLYFAEQVAKKFTPAIPLDKENSLSYIQNSATVVPNAILSSEIKHQSFSDDFRPKDGISFASNIKGIVDKKEAWSIGAIFLLFSFIFFAEGIRYQNAISSTKQEVAKLLEGHPALQSDYARENIANKYIKIDKIERSKREVLRGISKLMLPGVELETLGLDTKHFVSTFKIVDEKSLLRIKALATTKGYKVSRLGSKNLLKIEGSL